MESYATNLIELTLDAGPWLLLGLIAAGLIKAWLPEGVIERHLAGSGVKSIIKAAFIGAPLPLCSCGVIPAAIGLRKNGASKEATVAFLIATPETGVDSVAVSYALLGPFMAIIRPIASIISAIFAGVLVKNSKEERARPKPTFNIVSASVAEESSCCSTGSCSDTEEKTEKSSFIKKGSDGLNYAMTSILEDIYIWMVIGILLAAAVATFVPEDFLMRWGSGLPAMLIMMLIGIPMYICATASTPVAAGLLLAGVSPGTVLVFLLAGPATNAATIGVVYKELGKQSLIGYLIGVGVASIAFGLLTDWLVDKLEINMQVELTQSEHLVPEWFAITTTAIILVAILRLAWVDLIKKL